MRITHMKQANKRKSALLAGLTMVAASALAAERNLPTPNSDGYVDTESAVNASLETWQNLGRRITLTLNANATPSNAVQVAFGRDLNEDNNLAPEETELVLGCDCGEWFARDERIEQTGQPPQLEVTPTNCVFRFRQPADRSVRWNIAKVTTRGSEDSAASIVAEIVHPGIYLLLK